MKINRWWYSRKQQEMMKRLGDIHIHYVLVNGKRLPYTEWTTSLNVKCNWEDAILVAESEEKLPIMINGFIE